MTPTATPPSTPPDAWTALREDLETVMHNDPAARSVWEVLLTYPGLHAVWTHRLAHALWRAGARTQARLVSHIGRFWTGVEIHPGARLGRRVFIDHGMGVVIGETAVVGDDCLIYKGVVLGGTSLEPTKRHPTLGRRVVVGSNACILGAVVVGDRAKIGSGSVVVRDVPNAATAVGVPGRIVATTQTRYPLDHAALPDPISTVVRALNDQLEALTQRVAELEASAPNTSAALGAQATDRDGAMRHMSAVFFEHFEEDA